MKAFMRWVERYCVRHPRFGVENLMRYLIIGNAAVWLLTLMDRTGTVRYFLALNPQMILRGQIWRLVTFVLIPDTGGILGLLFLYFYYFIGTSMEREWGQAKFSMYFLTGMALWVPPFAGCFVNSQPVKDAPGACWSMGHREWARPPFSVGWRSAFPPHRSHCARF